MDLFLLQEKIFKPSAPRLSSKEKRKHLCGPNRMSSGLMKRSFSDSKIHELLAKSGNTVKQVADARAGCASFFS